MKCMKNIFTLLGICLCLCLPMSVSANETIKVGANFELSGPGGNYGQDMVDGINLAIDHLNQKGGLLDHRSVDLVTFDNRSDTTESASLAQRMIKEKVVGVLGPAMTGTSLATVPILSNGKVPLVLPAATGAGLTLKENGEVWEYLYRVCFEDPFQGRAGARFAYQHLKAKKVMVVTDAISDYSQGISDNFMKEYKGLGGDILSQAFFASGDRDFTALLTSIYTLKPDLIYLPCYYTEAGLFIKQAREMGIDTPILGSDGFASEVLLDLAGDQNTHDVYYTDHFSPLSDNPKVQSFLSDFQAKYHREASTFSALGYDAANLLFDAIERAQSTDTDKVNQALASTKDFEGVTGSFSIDANHNPIKSAVVVKLDQGKVDSAVEVQVK